MRSLSDTVAECQRTSGGGDAAGGADAQGFGSQYTSSSPESGAVAWPSTMGTPSRPCPSRPLRCAVYSFGGRPAGMPTACGQSLAGGWVVVKISAVSQDDAQTTEPSELRMQ